MNNYEFNVFTFKILRQMRANAPRDTGNLADNAMKRILKGDTCEIYVDLDIAPYGEYLEFGTGTSQVHMGWFEKCLESAVKVVALDYQAKVEK